MPYAQISNNILWFSFNHVMQQSFFSPYCLKSYCWYVAFSDSTVPYLLFICFDLSRTCGSPQIWQHGLSYLLHLKIPVVSIWINLRSSDDFSFHFTILSIFSTPQNCCAHSLYYLIHVWYILFSNLCSVFFNEQCLTIWLFEWFFRVHEDNWNSDQGIHGWGEGECVSSWWSWKSCQYSWRGCKWRWVPLENITLRDPESCHVTHVCHGGVVASFISDMVENRRVW